MRRALELSLTTIVIGILGFFGVGAVEKSILNARKKVLISQLYSIGRHLEIYYAEKNHLPNVADLMKAMGISVCHKNHHPAIKDCMELKRVAIGKRRKFWALSSNNGIIYYDSYSGETSAAVKGKSGLHTVAKITFLRHNGVSVIEHYAN